MNKKQLFIDFFKNENEVKHIEIGNFKIRGLFTFDGKYLKILYNDNVDFQIDMSEDQDFDEIKLYENEISFYNNFQFLKFRK